MAKVDDELLAIMAQIDEILEVAIAQMDLGAEINCMRHEIGGEGFGEDIIPAIALDITRKFKDGGIYAGDATVDALTAAAKTCLKCKINADGSWNQGQFVWSKIQESIFDKFGNSTNSNTERTRREEKLALQGVMEDLASGKFIIKPYEYDFNAQELAAANEVAAKGALGFSPWLLVAGVVGVGLLWKLSK